MPTPPLRQSRPRAQPDDDSALRPVDLDGDGALDLLAVGLFDGEVAWYRNLGGGRFAGQRVIVEHNRYGGFDTVDLDGDGAVVGFDIDSASRRLDLSTLETTALPLHSMKAG